MQLFRKIFCNIRFFVYICHELKNTNMKEKHVINALSFLLMTFVITTISLGSYILITKDRIKKTTEYTILFENKTYTKIKGYKCKAIEYSNEDGAKRIIGYKIKHADGSSSIMPAEYVVAIYKTEDNYPINFKK